MGQALVEFALTLPILLLLLLIALDFGRAFFGWVALNNAARVGANYAAAHPNDWDDGTTYEDLMAANVDLINCNQTNPDNPPTFGPTKLPGELARVNLDCEFTIVTPIVGAILGDTITVSSSAAFPITAGCLAACPTGPPAPPPPASTANNCRPVPDVVGLSVAGARAAWVSAGFKASNFLPSGAANDTRTVSARTVVEPTNSEECVMPKQFFEASMTVELAPLGPTLTPTCRPVPNLQGFTLSAARTAWTDAGFTGPFLPNGSNTQVVVSQVTDPPSSPGECLEPPTTITMTPGDPLPAPPPAPCKVPSFANTSSTLATGTWTDAGFDKQKLDFNPKPPNGGYLILSQTLVGGTYIGCDSTIQVSNVANPNNP